MKRWSKRSERQASIVSGVCVGILGLLIFDATDWRAWVFMVLVTFILAIERTIAMGMDE